jgi:hypothetical protein
MGGFDCIRCSCYSGTFVLLDICAAVSIVSRSLVYINGIKLTVFTPPYMCAYRKAGHRFLSAYVVGIIYNFRSDVVDNGEIVDITF